MKRSKTILASFVIMLLVGGLAFAGNGYGRPQYSDELTSTGRFPDRNQPLNSGAFDPDSKTTLVGHVYFDETELKIDTDQGTFSIHIGSQRFADSIEIDIQENEEIAVFGHVNESDVYPILIVIGEEAFYLRDTDGTPLWTGKRNS
jgi:hypothetical protein